MRSFAIPSYDIVKWKNLNKRFAGGKSLAGKVIQMQIKKRNNILNNLKKSQNVTKAFQINKHKKVKQK